ncbi:hypothetical protein COOONC_03331 [Cooperia oncophora]
MQSAGLPCATESAQVVAAGLFPDEGNSRWSNDSLGSWQPTPIYAIPQSTPDPHLRQPFHPCPAYKRLLDMENKNFYRQFDAENEKWYKLLEHHTGVIPFDRDAITMLYGIHNEVGTFRKI